MVWGAATKGVLVSPKARVTRERLTALEEELHRLENVARRELAERTVQEPGDLVDNTALQEVTADQEQLERRITTLRAQLRHAQVVEAQHAGRTRTPPPQSFWRRSRGPRQRLAGPGAPAVAADRTPTSPLPRPCLPTPRRTRAQARA